MYHLITIICMLSVSGVYAETNAPDITKNVTQNTVQLPVYPGAELVSEVAPSKFASHLVLLGSLKKVNNELQSEESVVIGGRKSSFTYYLPDARGTKEVGQFFEDNLSKLGQLLFLCEGRDCGNSSYWANKVFEMSILYGPEQYQHYYITRLPDELGYVAVYVGQRATKKVYAYIEYIETLPGNVEVGVNEVLAGMKLHGRFIFDKADSIQEESLLTSVHNALSVVNGTIVIVVHDSMRQGETLDESITRTSAEAERTAVSLNLKSRRTQPIVGRGVGPLAPSELYDSRRIEIIVLEKER